MGEYQRLDYQEEERIKGRLYREFEEKKKNELGEMAYQRLITYNLREFIHEQTTYVERRFTKERYKSKKDGE